MAHRFLLFAIIFFTTTLFSPYFLAERFSPSHIKVEEKGEKESYFPPILNQTFTYIGKGSQSFVFLGEDQTTILKFLRANRYRIDPRLTPRSLPPFLQAIYDMKKEAKKQKWEKVIESMHIADEELKVESHLLFTHLHTSKNLKKITLKDKLRRTFQINANETYFVVQKKGELLSDFLLECKKENDPEKGLNALVDLFALIGKREKKKIADGDTVLSKNIGFIDGAPFFIDIGEFYKKPSSTLNRSEWKKMASDFEPWIVKHYPEFQPYYSFLKEIL